MSKSNSHSDANKAVARRYFYEVFNKADMNTLEEICAPDFSFYLPTHAEPFRGVEGYKGLVQMLVGCFPDIHFAVEDMLSEGDTVLTRWSARGTHTGIPFPTILGDVPAVGNTFQIEGMTWHRIVDGKIAEVLANEDGMGLVQQLGRALFPDRAPLIAKPTSHKACKAGVSHYYNDLLNKKKLSILDELLTPNFVLHLPTLKDPVRGVEAMKQFVTALHQAFPDLHYKVEREIIDHHSVAVRYSLTGTHKGEFMGIAPTGKSIKDAGNDIFHFDDGRIAEIWGSDDALGVFHQMGAIA